MVDDWVQFGMSMQPIGGVSRSGSGSEDGASGATNDEDDSRRPPPLAFRGDIHDQVGHILSVSDQVGHMSLSDQVGHLSVSVDVAHPIKSDVWGSPYHTVSS